MKKILSKIFVICLLLCGGCANSMSIEKYADEVKKESMDMYNEDQTINEEYLKSFDERIDKISDNIINISTIIIDQSKALEKILEPIGLQSTAWDVENSVVGLEKAYKGILNNYWEDLQDYKNDLNDYHISDLPDYIVCLDKLDKLAKNYQNYLKEAIEKKDAALFIKHKDNDDIYKMIKDNKVFDEKFDENIPILSSIAYRVKYYSRWRGRDIEGTIQELICEYYEGAAEIEDSYYYN